eukprot:TRINITY_DN1722_c0_g1_i1.p1 TRINITY_DN1722_c0_g1~~TRINITY_DN1722_c0_g1_i1.p1  ORF type:complete len:798 (+),score=259.35 TRINITY_DN1722_c0_g1_i1:98-2491(+)
MAGAGAPVDVNVADSTDYDEKVRQFSNYLHSNRDEWEKKIDKELSNKRYRIPLDLREIEAAGGDGSGLARQFLNAPVKYLLPWEEALLSFLRDINEKALKTLKHPLRLDVQGAFGRNRVTPRGLTSDTLGKLMCVEGVVTKAGMREPKIIQSIHSRKNGDGHVESRDHRDGTAFVNTVASGAMPTHDAEGNELVMEVGLSYYKDEQMFMLQEAPEHAPSGQIPRAIEVVCDGDLTDKCKPGDRIQVVGVYRGFPPTTQDYTTGIWPSRLIATSITQVKELMEAPFVSQDVTNIKAIAEREDAFQLLARSFAPSICGHEKVKAGLLLQLIGGTEKNLANGTHLRGDINCLMIGDPSCGKSQMLRFVMNSAPLAISTTGRGSSGVGLTAALTRDQGSRDFQIEAGAMVLADRGVICIDEFDKMGQNDRVAIHEAMEQQCVTIAKAGLHVTLNARCSVTAAANPVYGTFDSGISLAQNIGMPDSLLSRFDLIFIVRDNSDEFIDKKIAAQVLSQHRYKGGDDDVRRGVEQIHSSIIERRQQVDNQRLQEPTEVYEKRYEEEGKEPVLTVDFLRKYIKYCKRFTPVLSEAAQPVVAERYVDMRKRFQSGFTDTSDPKSEKKPRLAVTTRTLEALIRLATAHAKLKLRKDEVLPEDVEEAYKLMLMAREEAPTVIMGEDPEGGDDGADDGADDAGAQAGKKRKRASKAADKEAPASKKAAAGEATTLSAQRFSTLETNVGRTFARMGQLMSEMPKGELLESVNAELLSSEEPFTQEEFEAGLAQMEAANKLLLEGDLVISVL